MTGRLLSFRFEDDAMSLALDEAILRIAGSKQPRETVRVYFGSGSIVLGARGSITPELERAKGEGYGLLRRPSSGDPYMMSPEWISISLVKPCAGEAAGQTASKLTEALRNLLGEVGVEVSLEGTSLVGRFAGTRVMSGGLAFYRDAALLQAAVWVSGRAPVRALPEGSASLSSTLGRRLGPRSLLDRLAERASNAGYTPGEPTPEEIDLAELLVERKYLRHEWVERSVEPLTLKDLLVEVFIANPPTSRCREFLRSVAEAVRGLEDRVEVRVWRRGMGRPPGVPFSGGLMRAAKESKIPAVIIGGELIYHGRAPSSEEVRGEILRRLNPPSSESGGGTGSGGRGTPGSFPRRDRSP